MLTRICGGKRARSTSPETIAKRINTLHIGPPPSPLAGRKRNGTIDEYSLIEPVIQKRLRESLEDIEESTDTIKEKYNHETYIYHPKSYEFVYSCSPIS